MTNKRALLVGDQGDHFLIALETAPLLKRAGFTVNAVTGNPMVRKLSSVSACIAVPRAGDLPYAALAQMKAEDYDLIVVLEDFTLKTILDSDLTDEEKLVLLPVVGTEDFSHICSKIGLSRAFRRRGIRTPDFAEAQDAAELARAAERIGYPVVVKIDFSGAGAGTFACAGPEEVAAAIGRIDRWPVVVQKFIAGTEVDLSAFYQGAELVSFGYARIEDRATSGFAPTAVRTYTQLAKVGEEIFEDVRAIGRATGADGFVNLSCILSEADGLHYYFEADMRPNAWVNAPRHFGDDPARRIAGYFSEARVMTYPQPLDPAFPERITVPCFPRIGLWELATNRYGAWRVLPEESASVVLFTLAELKFKDFARSCIRPLVPSGLWSRLKRSYDVTFRRAVG